MYTGEIKADTDYKTIRVSASTNARTAISVMLNKFRLSCRDPNLFELCMELRTKRSGAEVRENSIIDAFCLSVLN